MSNQTLVAQESIGVVIGQTSTTRVEFLLRANLPARPRIGEFVKLANPDSPTTGTDILGRIVSIVKKNQLIGSDFSPSGVELLTQVSQLSFLGIDEQHTEMTLGRVNIVGYRLGSSILRPRYPFAPGSKVHLVDSDFLSEVISPPDPGRSIEIGWIQGHPSVPVRIDISRSLPRHIAILAMTGAGKSWTVGRISEQLLYKFPNCKIVVLDPHGEYSRMKFRMEELEFENYLLPFPETRERERERYAEVQLLLGSGVKVLIPPHPEAIERLNSQGIETQKFQVDPLELDFDALANLLPDLTEPQSATLGRVFRDLSEKHRAGETIGSRRKAFLGKIDALNVQWNVKAALMRKIEALLENPLFQGIGSSKINEIINSSGNIFVFDLSSEDVDIQRVIGGFIGYELLRERIRKRIRRPVLLIVEEAHNFAPQGRQRFFSSRIIRKISSEGRKFGVGLCVVSQRPSLLSEDILAQCNTHIIQKIVNPRDRKYVQNSCEYASKEEIDELPGFLRGEAFLFGSAVDIPLLVQIGPRVSQHGGAEQRFDLEWR